MYRPRQRGMGDTTPPANTVIKCLDFDEEGNCSDWSTDIGGSQWIKGVPNVAVAIAGALFAVMLLGGRR